MSSPGPLAFAAEELEGTIPQRFASVVEARPDALAVSTGTARVSYGDLDRRSAQVAAAILRSGPGGDTPAAVLVNDPVSMIVSMLATWRAGRLCVPLEPDLPLAQLEVILRDSGAGVVLTDREGSAALLASPGLPARQLRIDAHDLDPAANLPRVSVIADQPACLLYTSGSTGQPKGLVRSHRSWLHRVRCSITSLGVRQGDRVSALHSAAFATGMRDVLTALLSGATLLPFDSKRAGSRALAEWIDREQVTILCTVATTFRRLLAETAPAQHFPSVRVVRVGAESLLRPDVERFRAHFSSQCLLIHGYGASEAAGIVEYRMTRDTPLPTGRVPVGFPLEGVELLLLDDDGRPVANGAPGEVAVRSRYVSEGYWRRPDLTQDRFSSEAAENGSRVYRTGDIGRLRPDGCLELVGRKDHQVKVRGYRVQTDGIEAALAEHPSVCEAAVIGRVTPDGGARLVAYVVPRRAVEALASELRSFLRSRLPLYMVPADFVILEALPVGPTGKVKRDALPAPPAPARTAAFVPPRSALEQLLAGIWEDLFGVPSIGRHDDFFDLGGDSLSAAVLVSAIKERCDCVMSPSVLLRAPTVSTLAAAILQSEDPLDEPLTPLRESGTRAPVFFVHNDHGRGIYTRALARALAPDRPFYAVHLHGLAQRTPSVSIETLAADRLRAVRAVRPRGPYAVGGYCKGGNVALEMARQLQVQGEQVINLFLVDTRAPRRRLLALHRVSGVLAKLRRLSPHEASELFSRIDCRVQEAGVRGRYYRQKFMALRQSGPRGWMDFPAHGSPPPSVGMDWESVYRRAVRLYIPPPYSGATTIFRSEGFPTARPDLGWSGFLHNHQVVVIPGDHQSSITRHVGVLGAKIELAIQNAETAARPD